MPEVTKTVPARSPTRRAASIAPFIVAFVVGALSIGARSDRASSSPPARPPAASFEGARPIADAAVRATRIRRNRQKKLTEEPYWVLLRRVPGVRAAVDFVARF
jgi:hypothetical protein